MYDDTLKEMERQRRRDAERALQEEREKAYNEATHSASFKVFDSIIGTVTVVISVVICLYFLWCNSKPVFALVVAMLVLSCVFRRLSKYYFIKGNRKKFETFNKLAGVMGVSASIIELADYNKGRTRGAFDKIESLESSATSTYRAITDISVTGGMYVDSKYDDYRNRCVKLGKHLYLSGDTSKCRKVLDAMSEFEKKATNMPNECKTCVNVLYMLSDDFIKNNYQPEDEYVAYAAIGALHYFVNPLKDVPDTIPIAGYRDNMFMPLCVTGGYLESINAYKDWKIKSVKQKELKGLLEANSDALKTIYKDGKRQYQMGAANTLLAAVRNNKRAIARMDDEIMEMVQLMYHLLDDFYHDRYTLIHPDAIYYITGALYYLSKPNDIIYDKTPITGLLDDEIIIRAVFMKNREACDSYSEWRINQQLEGKLDPLSDYLDTVIGENITNRREEIDRLAAMCPDDAITDTVARARAAVVRLF